MLRDIEKAAYENRLAVINPVEKLVFAMGLLMITLVLPPWPWALITLLLATVAALAVARVPAAVYLKAVVGPFMFTLWGAAGLLLSLDLEGSTRLALHLPGVEQAALLAGRSLAAISCSILLIVTTPVAHILALLPVGGVWGAIREIIVTTYTTLFLFLDSCTSMYRAQQARLGYVNGRTALRSVANLAAALWMSVSTRAQRLHLGLTARGYPEGLHSLASFRPIAWGRVAALLVSEGLLLVLGLEGVR